MQLFASLREGSDGHNQAGAAVKLISIHAPAKGATFAVWFCRVGIVISIHAPAKGATFVVPLSSNTTAYFNPRSREGSDNSIFEVRGTS